MKKIFCSFVLIFILVFVLYYYKNNPSSSTYLYNDSHTGSKDKKVYIISNLHCHPDTQKIIKNIICNLKQKYREDLQVIGQEGSFKRLDTSILDQKYSPKVKKRIVKKLLNRGYITGAELYDIENKDIFLFGIENQELYIKDFIYLCRSLEYKKAVEPILDDIWNILNDFKKVLYTNDLNFFLGTISEYENKQKSIGEYADLIVKKALSLNINNIGKNTRILYESYNIEDKYNMLKLKDYIGSIDWVILKQELKSLEYQIELELESSDLGRDIVYITKYFNLLKCLLSGKIFLEDYYDLKENYNMFRAKLDKIIRMFNTGEILDDNEAELNIACNNMFDFYNKALKRNEFLVVNLLKRMKKYNSKVSIMLVGGFHTQGITRILRNNNISFEVITPISKVRSSKCLYLKRLQEQASFLGLTKLASNFTLPDLNFSINKLDFISTFETSINVFESISDNLEHETLRSIWVEFKFVLDGFFNKYKDFLQNDLLLGLIKKIIINSAMSNNRADTVVEAIETIYTNKSLGIDYTYEAYKANKTVSHKGAKKKLNDYFLTNFYLVLKLKKNAIQILNLSTLKIKERNFGRRIIKNMEVSKVDNTLYILFKDSTVTSYGLYFYIETLSARDRIGCNVKVAPFPLASTAILLTNKNEIKFYDKCLDNFLGLKPVIFRQKIVDMKCFDKLNMIELRFQSSDNQLFYYDIETRKFAFKIEHSEQILGTELIEFNKRQCIVSRDLGGVIKVVDIESRSYIREFRAFKNNNLGTPKILYIREKRELVIYRCMKNILNVEVYDLEKGKVNHKRTLKVSGLEYIQTIDKFIIWNNAKKKVYLYDMAREFHYVFKSNIENIKSIKFIESESLILIFGNNRKFELWELVVKKNRIFFRLKYSRSKKKNKKNSYDYIRSKQPFYKKLVSLVSCGLLNETKVYPMDIRLYSKLGERVRNAQYNLILHDDMILMRKDLKSLAHFNSKTITQFMASKYYSQLKRKVIEQRFLQPKISSRHIFGKTIEIIELPNGAKFEIRIKKGKRCIKQTEKAVLPSKLIQAIEKETKQFTMQELLVLKVTALYYVKKLILPFCKASDSLSYITKGLLKYQKHIISSV